MNLLEAEDIQFPPFDPEQDREALAAFLAADTWPFHGSSRVSLERARAWVEGERRFEGPENATFWICLGAGEGAAERERVGVLAVHELDDPTPVFDLRLRGAARGRGIGRRALAFLARWAFTDADKPRIEAHTRADNARMRGLLRACGWVKEAHHREVWPDDEGRQHDAVTYALLRRDWLQGTTTPVRWDDEP